MRRGAGGGSALLYHGPMVYHGICPWGEGENGKTRGWFVGAVGERVERFSGRGVDREEVG